MKSSFLSLKMGLLALSLAATAGGMQACTSGEVGLGLGAAALGAVVGGALANDHHDHHHARCHEGYKSVCHEYHDYYGRWHRDCRQVWDSCAQYYSASIGVSADASALNDDAIRLAAKYSLSVDGTQKLLVALQAAQFGKTDELQKMGLTERAVEDLILRRKLSPEALDVLAKAMNTHVTVMAEFVFEMNKEFEAQSANPKSPLWKTCVAAGSWATPENLNCQNTEWAGCSVETGASTCAPQFAAVK
jgi:hypothetical protein